MSTEYFPSIPWSSLISQWSLEKRIRIGCGLIVQILSALEHAHAKGMVHRDIKPENILISRVETKLVAKLADFGLAKQYINAGLSQMTRNGDVIGSLAYMSPEQFINSRDTKPASDLYSAGATLYWFLTGRPPIDIENHPCKFLAILEEPPTPLKTVCPTASDALCQFVQRVLEKNVDVRFSSASEMRKQLRLIINLEQAK